MSTAEYDWLDYYKRNTPDKTALIDLASGRKFSYLEMENRVVPATKRAKIGIPLYKVFLV